MVKRLQLLAVVAGYVAALFWAYATILSPTFGYEGFALVWRNTGEMVWITGMALLPALFLPCSFLRPSALILWWLYLAAYIPSIVVPPISTALPFRKLMVLQLVLLLAVGLLWLTAGVKVLALRRIAINARVFWLGFGLVWLACIAFLCMHGRAHLLVANFGSLLSGGDEYAIRKAFFSELGQVGKLPGYAAGQLSQALDPFLIAFGLLYRRRLCLFAGILGQILMFGLTGLKIVLFSPLFLVLMLLFIRRWRRSFGAAFATVLIAAIFICALADRTSDKVFYSSLFTRRTLAVPGLLTGFYFEHYSQVPHAGVGFRFSPWAPPYLGPPAEIGLVYFGSSEIDANANLWAEGFADFGLSGIVGFTLLVALLIWICDSIAARHDADLGALLIAMPAVCLSNTAPTTVLLTHGGLAAMFLLWLSPNPNCDFHRVVEPAGRERLAMAETSV